MKKKTLGMMIAALRKENEMTQLDLAEKMGVAVVVLSFLKELDVNSGMGMFGIGLACLAITSLAKRDEEEN